MNDTGNLLSEVRSLMERDRDRVFVHHEPWTARYIRAERDLKRVVFQGRLIGSKRVQSGEPGFEIVVWNDQDFEERYGLYSVFRIYAQDNGKISSAILYCFYDGKDKSSEKFRTEASAREFMKGFGYEGTNDV